MASSDDKFAGGSLTGNLPPVEPMVRKDGPREIPDFLVRETRSVQDMVIHDIENRKLVGLTNYGELLQVNNGRSHLIDLYEELLDAACYVRALIEQENENEGPMVY